jgi:hypothetical protein
VGIDPTLIELKFAVTELTTYEDDCLLTEIEVESTLPEAVVILTVPVFANFGTIAVICVLLFMVNLAGVSPNLTEVTPVRLVPLITKLLLIEVEALPKLVNV